MCLEAACRTYITARLKKWRRLGKPKNCSLAPLMCKRLSEIHHFPSQSAPTRPARTTRVLDTPRLTSPLLSNHQLEAADRVCQSIGTRTSLSVGVEVVMLPLESWGGEEPLPVIVKGAVGGCPDGKRIVLVSESWRIFVAPVVVFVLMSGTPAVLLVIA